MHMDLVVLCFLKSQLQNDNYTNLHSPLLPVHTAKLHFSASLAVRLGHLTKFSLVEREQKLHMSIPGLAHRTPNTCTSKLYLPPCGKEWWQPKQHLKPQVESRKATW